MKTDRPQNVKIPPIIHKNRETPTEPVMAKMPEGVEKTADCKQMLIISFSRDVYVLPVPIILFRMTNTVAVYPSF